MQFPDSVSSNESIARFMMESSKYRIGEMRVYYSAFLPARDNILSVFRIDNLVHEQIIDIGQEFVAAPQAKEIKAYGVVQAAQIFDQGLEMLPTAEPHPRHVDVSGWTDKETNRSRAQIISEYATLVLK
jgi:hypothetical protein